MIENDDGKYDFESHSFADAVERNSTCYNPLASDLKNLKIIEDFLDGDKYKSLHSIEVHIEYIEQLLNTLQNARQAERGVCPTNAELDQEIAKVQQLNRRLASKLSGFL